MKPARRLTYLITTTIVPLGESAVSGFIYPRQKWSSCVKYIDLTLANPSNSIPTDPAFVSEIDFTTLGSSCAISLSYSSSESSNRNPSKLFEDIQIMKQLLQVGLAITGAFLAFIVQALPTSHAGELKMSSTNTKIPNSIKPILKLVKRNRLPTEKHSKEFRAFLSQIQGMKEPELTNAVGNVLMKKAGIDMSLLEPDEHLGFINPTDKIRPKTLRQKILDFIRRIFKRKKRPQPPPIRWCHMRGAYAAVQSTLFLSWLAWVGWVIWRFVPVPC
ncbi:hypothetical protein CROQUDRAFT_447428 [Cronartium quercuum f. sp. fusiforme G11]|uniref:Uncharacterized protein n=1 Tax=Cronartium quercuum f. sp. fusiforme G11 TaxID=708437 RepID=A0A9P6N890_9BASI|nr:hypothetical protein CROQUDRAFT_447428 [Cronartium quercuum f. sp. fusiforme G11]